MAPCTIHVCHGFLDGSADMARCSEVPVWERAPLRLPWGTSRGELRLERQYRGDAHHGQVGDDPIARED